MDTPSKIESTGTATETGFRLEARVNCERYTQPVELKDGIDGLVHISQISEERIDKVKDVLKPGQEVDARVIKIDREERRLGLSIKAANYSESQLAAETSAYEQLNRSAGNDMMNLGDILDEAAKKD